MTHEQVVLCRMYSQRLISREDFERGWAWELEYRECRSKIFGRW